MKKNISDYVLASRKGSRDAEIEMYGRPLPKHKVHESKKNYTRKNKSWKRDIPLSFF